MSELQRASIPRPPVYRITLVQLVVLVPPVLVLWFFKPMWAKAVLAGAMIEILARAYFGFYAFRYMGAQQMRLVVRSLRRGELGKFLLVAVLFGGLFVANKGLQPLPVFAGYLTAWLLGVVLSMRMLR